METIVILVCCNEKWVTSKKMCKYKEGDSKGLIVPRTITFAELLDCVHHIGYTTSREDKVFLKFSVFVASNEEKHIKIEDDDDVKFFYEVQFRMGRSSVANVESNEVTRNNTNVADVEGDVGIDFMDMIDFSEVEEMHDGDNGIEANEVSVYSAPPILGRLDTSAQLPIMHLGGEFEPTCEHYLSQMGPELVQCGRCK
ncbi:hypothetical protein L3X38_018611 [Prunus dulcis]|uniref:Uncharacterized protein n=1 Tax=Prunus dulcis TaxID=3755 RepID=A0AAD4ZBA8_PRUDU|nr:hypothetical protein L3X38_018611 [Prunus dulcis]